VAVEQAQAHASIALHAVEEVHPQALASSADITEGAVVDVSAGLVIKQVTDAAVVAGEAGPAAGAAGGHGLPRGAHHAHHLSHGVPVQAVVRHLIMTKPAASGN
jgi:hypothetical protein